MARKGASIKTEYRDGSTFVVGIHGQVTDVSMFATTAERFNDVLPVAVKELVGAAIKGAIDRGEQLTIFGLTEEQVREATGLAKVQTLHKEPAAEKMDPTLPSAPPTRPRGRSQRQHATA